MLEDGVLLALPVVDRATKIAHLTRSNIPHVESVVRILTSVQVSDEAIAAAWAHDAVEKRKIEMPKIRSLFPGLAVSSIIYRVTAPGRGASWVDHTSAKRGLISGMSNDALLVKAADVIADLDTALRHDADFQTLVPNKALFLQDMEQTVQALTYHWKRHPFNEMLESRVRKLSIAFANAER